MTTTHSLTALAVAVLTSPAGAGAATQQELTDALVGNTFKGDMGGGGYSSFFDADGTYHDAGSSGTYEITVDGVCYPGTHFGCYQADVDGTSLEWSKDGESAGAGTILEGDALGLKD